MSITEQYIKLLTDDAKLQALLRKILGPQLDYYQYRPGMEEIKWIITNQSVFYSSVAEMKVLKAAGFEYTSEHIRYIITRDDLSILDDDFWQFIFPLNEIDYKSMIELIPVLPNTVKIQKWIEKMQYAALRASPGSPRIWKTSNGAKRKAF